MSSQASGFQPEPSSAGPEPLGGGAATVAVAAGDGAGVWAVAVGAAGVAGVNVGDGWAGGCPASMIGSST